jgi:hypothetical protein
MIREGSKIEIIDFIILVHKLIGLLCSLLLALPELLAPEGFMGSLDALQVYFFRGQVHRCCLFLFESCSVSPPALFEQGLLVEV